MFSNITYRRIRHIRTNTTLTGTFNVEVEAYLHGRELHARTFPSSRSLSQFFQHQQVSTDFINMYARHASTSNPRRSLFQPNAVSPERQERRLLPSVAVAGTTRNETRANHPGAPTHHRQVRADDVVDQRTFPVLFLPRNHAGRPQPDHAIDPPNQNVGMPNVNNFVDLIGGDSMDDSSSSTGSVQTVSSAELRSCRRQLHRRELPSDISSYESSSDDGNVPMDGTVRAFRLHGRFITDFNILHVEVRGLKMRRHVLVQYRTDFDNEIMTRVVPFEYFNSACHELIYGSTHHPQDGHGKIHRVDPQTGEIFYVVDKILEYEETTDMVRVKWAFTQEPSSGWIARSDMPDVSDEEIKEDISENDTSSL